MASIPHVWCLCANMWYALAIFLFALLLKSQGVFACSSAGTKSAVVYTTTRKPIPLCSTWIRNGTENISTVLNSELAAKAFLIPWNEEKLVSEKEFSTLVDTITNVSAMSSVMDEKGPRAEIGSTVATIIKFLSTNTELGDWFPNVPCSDSDCRIQDMSTTEHIQAVFIENSTMTERMKNAKLAMDSLEEIISQFGNPTSGLAQTKGASAPYLLSVATIFAAVGRLVVRYESTCGCGSDFTGTCQVTETDATSILSKDYIDQIRTNFDNLKKLIKEYSEAGVKERLDQIQMANGTLCKYIYEGWEVNQDNKCGPKRREDPNIGDKFLTGCVLPNEEGSKAVTPDFPLPEAFFDSGANKHICALQDNCPKAYELQVKASYKEHFEAVLPRLYLGNKAQALSTSWNALLNTTIFPAEKNNILSPTCDKGGVLQELNAILKNKSAKEEIHANYRKFYHKSKEGGNLEIFVQTLLANAEKNLDYEVGLSPWYTKVNRFADKV